jgi:hypothetical protein
MTAACGNCAATTEPLTDGLCPTCRTLTLMARPLADPASNGHAEPVVPETVELGELLDELAGFVRRFVVVSPAQSDVAALWIAHTHCFEAADQTPYLSVTSAEKRSGKTRLLEVMELLVARPWFTGRVSAAALVRKVDAERPTLLLDESDAPFNGEMDYAAALRGLLNTGHRDGGRSTICVGQGTETSYKDFSTYGPKAIAGIGKLPDTVADRSIPIRLERRAAGETAERFIRRDARIEAAPLAAGSRSSLGSCPSSSRPGPTSPRRSTTGPRRRPSRCSPSLTGPGATGPRARRAIVECTVAARSMTSPAASGCWPTSARCSRLATSTDWQARTCSTTSTSSTRPPGATGSESQCPDAGEDVAAVQGAVPHRPARRRHDRQGVLA